MRVVSLTPGSVDRDSRTFKQAASMTRLGHESVVVEGVRSQIDRADLPFELISPPPAADAAPPDADPAPTTDAARPRGIRALANRVLDVPFTIRSHARGGELPDADLYWLHGYHQYPPVARTNKPYVYDAHDFYSELIEGGARTRIESAAMAAFWRRLELRCTKHAASVVTVSDGLARLIEKRTGRHPKVVRNAAELRIDADPGRTLRTEAGVSGEDFLVVMVGNNKPGSNAEAAVDALASLPADVHISFVGKAYEPVADHARRRGVTERLHIHERVPAPAVVRFIRDADAGALFYVPSLANAANGLPNGFFSSVAAELPLVYPQALPEIRSLAERYDLGVAADTSDPSAIAAAILALRDDRERLRANIARARDELNWEHEERVLQEVLREALPARP